MIVCILAATLGEVTAKRGAPKPVEPVLAGNVEYSAPHESLGVVVATDIKSKKELWRERIYELHINPALERDVQDIFIATLSVEGGVLIITREDGVSFALDLTTRKVTQHKK